MLTLDEYAAKVKDAYENYGLPLPSVYRHDAYDPEYDDGPWIGFVWQQPPFMDLRLELDYDLRVIDCFTVVLQDNRGFVVSWHGDVFPGELIRAVMEQTFCRDDQFEPYVCKYYGETRALRRELFEDFERFYP